MRESSANTMCHTSWVTFHVPPNTCHLSHVMCILKVKKYIITGQSGGASQGRVCYQRGLPRLFYRAGISADCPVSEMLNKVTSTMVDGGGAAGEQVSTEGVDGFENKWKIQVRKLKFF